MKIKIVSIIVCMLLFATTISVAAAVDTTKNDIRSPLLGNTAVSLSKVKSLEEKMLLGGTIGWQADVIGFVREAAYYNSTNQVHFYIRPICLFTYTHYYNRTVGFPWVHFLFPIMYDVTGCWSDDLIGFHGTITGHAIKFIKGKIIWAQDIP